MADMAITEEDVNAMLTFRDEEGKEWVAAAIVGPLLRPAANGQPDEVMGVEKLKDRVFTLIRFTVVLPD